MALLDKGQCKKLHHFLHRALSRELACCAFQKLFCKVLSLLAVRPVPPCDPREPVLYVRCSGSSDKALGGDAANGSWSPKIGAVMRTSLEGTLALDHFRCTGL